MHQYYWQCVHRAATISSIMQYWQFLDKNFKQYLIICKSGIKQVLRVEGHLQHLSDRQQFILHIYIYIYICACVCVCVCVTRRNVRPLRFPCFRVSYSIELPVVMNIKTSEVFMTATKKCTKCHHCFQVSVHSSVATWQHSPADNSVDDILLQWKQNVTFGDLHSFLSVYTFQCHSLSVYKIDSLVFLGKPCYSRVTLTA
jgi:hypothetical protein